MEKSGVGAGFNMAGRGTDYWCRGDTPTSPEVFETIGMSVLVCEYQFYLNFGKIVSRFES